MTTFSSLYYGASAASMTALAAFLALDLAVLWAILPRKRRSVRSVPALAMAAALVWLCGCAPAADTAGTASELTADAADSVTGTADANASTAGDSETDAAGTAGEASAASGGELEILGFQAGKADAFLLTTASHTVLIDAGEKGFGKTILAELESRGITRVDYLIITHFDQDHVGGAAKVINNIEVGTILQTNRPKDSEEYEKYVKAVTNAAIEPVTVQETYTFTLDGVSFSVDPPRKSKYQSDSSNNSSLIVTVRDAERSFLFMGDAQTERIEEFLEWNEDTYDVLKVPHHGREEPLLSALLEEVRPAYAIVTSSDEEPEDAAALSELQDAAEVYLTRTAPVVIRCDGSGLEVGYSSM